jgi:hypothetical protein
MTPCGLVDRYHLFGGISRLHLQNGIIGEILPHMGVFTVKVTVFRDVTSCYLMEYTCNLRYGLEERR